MKQATERDLRRPELRDADPADYEVRADGSVVRKDRWEVSLRTIWSLVADPREPFEAEDVVERVRRLVP